MALQRIQYPGLIQPVNTSGGAPAETVTADKWLAGQQIPVRPKSRVHLAPCSDAAFSPSTFPVPGFYSQDAQVTFSKTVIAQGRFETLQAISSAEVVTSDKWTPDAETPLRKRAVTQPTSGTAPIDAFPRPDVFAQWMFEQPPKIWDRKRLQWTYPSFFIDAAALALPETPQLDKWLGEKPAKIFDRARRQWTYPNFFTDSASLTQPETAQLDKWIGERPAKIFDRPRRQWAAPHLFFEPFARSNPFPLSGFDQPSRGQKRGQFQNLFAPVVQPEPAPLDWVRATQIDRHADRKRIIPPTSFFDANPIVSGESITADKWWRLTETPPARRKRPQELPGVSPVLNAFGETITPDKWQGARQEPLRSRARAVQPPLDLPYAPAETITLDKWAVSRPEQIRGRARSPVPQTGLVVPVADLTRADGWQYPAQFPVRVRRIVSAEGTSDLWQLPLRLDAWTPITGEVRRPARDVRKYLTDAHIELAATLEPVTLDKWFSGNTLLIRTRPLSLDAYWRMPVAFAPTATLPIQTGTAIHRTSSGNRNDAILARQRGAVESGGDRSEDTDASQHGDATQGSDRSGKIKGKA